MRIEIWSDVVCPWCGIGEKRLQNALQQFGHADEIEVVHRSFQLDASAPLGQTGPVREMLQRKYNLPASRVEAMGARVQALAAEEGLVPYHTLDNRFGNTFLTHQFLAHATASGLADEAWARMFHAYFGEQRSVFERDTLLDIGEELGLDREQTAVALDDGRYADQVTRDGVEARELGCTGVPFVVIDRKVGIPGAQPTETFLAALQNVWAETQAEVVDGEACGIDGC